MSTVSVIVVVPFLKCLLYNAEMSGLISSSCGILQTMSLLISLVKADKIHIIKYGGIEFMFPDAIVKSN